MADEDKKKIWICLGDIKDIPIYVKPSDMDRYKKAVDMVNKLWGSWKMKFVKQSSEEVMARVAFQFARLYLEANTRNAEVNEVLADFEQKLNDIIVKVQREDS